MRGGATKSARRKTKDGKFNREDAKYAKEEKRRDVNWFLGSAWELI